MKFIVATLKSWNIELAKELAHHESMDTTARFYMEKKSEAETLKEINALMTE